MSRIFCHYLQSEQPALTKVPYTGELAEYLKAHISQTAWDQWKAQQIRLINEYRLSPLRVEDKQRLEREMRAFFKISQTFK